MSLIDELTAAHLAGELAEEERRALMELLRGDADARRRFACLCRDDMVLREVARTAPARGRGERTPTPRRTRRASTQRHQRVRRGRQSGPLWTVAALAAGLAVAVVLTWQPGGPAPSSSAGGIAEVIRAGGPLTADGRAVAAGARLAAGATLVADGGCELRLLADGSTLTLAPGARLRLESGGLRARLEQGRVTAQVRAQQGGRFAIAAPQATATVLGTVFTLEAAGAATRLAVAEGVVRFAPASGPVVEVAAGADAEAGVDGLAGPVLGFALIDAGRDAPLGASTRGRLAIARAALPAGGLSLRVDCTPEVRALRIDAQGAHGRAKGVVELEQVPPFSLTGDLGGDFKPWHPTPGTYRISVQACRDEDGRQPVGAPAALTLVIDP